MLPGEVEEELVNELPAPVHLQLLILILKVCEQHAHAIRGLDRRHVIIKEKLTMLLDPIYP